MKELKKGNYDGSKIILHPFSKGGRFPYVFSSEEYQLKWEKMIIFSSLFCLKIQNEKTFDVTMLKCSLQNPCIFFETMDSVGKKT